MSNIEELKTKLQGLSAKLATKDELGKEYKRIVSESLDRIKQKITKIIEAHNKKIQEITSESTSNLEKTRAELVSEQDKIKQASDAALDAANKNQTELQNKLAETNNRLKELQNELNRPNPDTQNMQVIIEKLRNDLQNAQTAEAASSLEINTLKAKLVAYDGLRDKMDQLVKELLNKIGEILNQVDVMSINQADIVELMDLLKNTEDMFPKDDESSSSNDGGFFGNLFGTSTPTTRPSNFPTGRLYRKGEVMPKGGGKTKRRKTMHRGGYINRLRTKKHRKYTRTNKRRSSRSSKSSSKSSKHSA